MHSATNSEGSWLIRIIVVYAQTRVAIGARDTFLRERYERHAFREACSVGHHQASSEARGEVCSLSTCHNLVVDSIFQQN